jgi:hypothetical protein
MIYFFKMMNKAFWLWIPGSYNLIITTITPYTSTRIKTENQPNSLNDKILKANFIAKSPSLIDENLHGKCLASDMWGGSSVCHGHSFLVVTMTVTSRFLCIVPKKRFDRGFIQDNILST